MFILKLGTYFVHKYYIVHIAPNSFEFKVIQNIGLEQKWRNFCSIQLASAEQRFILYKKKIMKYQHWFNWHCFIMSSCNVTKNVVTVSQVDHDENQVPCFKKTFF